LQGSRRGQWEQAGEKSKDEGRSVRTSARFKEGAWGNKQEGNLWRRELGLLHGSMRVLVGTSRSSATKYERNFYISGGMDYNSARIKPTIFLRNL